MTSNHVSSDFAASLSPFTLFYYVQYTYEYAVMRRCELMFSYFSGLVFDDTGDGDVFLILVFLWWIRYKISK